MFSKPVARMGTQFDAEMRALVRPFSDWRFPLLSAALVVGALLLRLYHIGDAELWVDEAFSFYVATLKANLGHVLVTENSPPLYYLLLRLWVGLIGTSETALRLPSAIFGTLFVATVIWAGSAFFCRRVGLWAGAFAMVAPIHIYYSQEARPYALVIFLLLLTYALVWRALDRDTWQSWAWVSLVAALAIYSHYFALLGLVPTAMLVWCRREVQSRRRVWRRYGITMTVCGLVVVPWIALSGAFSRPPAGWDWLTTVWENTPPVLAIPKTLEFFGLGGQAGLFPIFPKIFRSVVMPGWLRMEGLAALLILGVWVMISWRDHRPEISGITRRKTWLWAALFFPLVSLWLLSWFYKPVYHVGRYDLIAFPAYCLLVGFGMAKFQAAGRHGWLLAIGLTTILLMPIGSKLSRYYEAASTQAMAANTARVTAKELFERAQSGDVAVFTGLRGLPVLYYMDRLGVTWTEGMCEERMTSRRFSCRLYPRENEAHPAVDDPKRVRSSKSAVEDDVQDLLAGLREPTNRLWLAFGQYGYTPDLFGTVGGLALEPQDVTLVEVLWRLGFRLAPSAVLGGSLFEARRNHPADEVSRGSNSGSAATTPFRVSLERR